MLGEPFQQNVFVGPWLVDFFLPSRNLVIEVDGIYWHSRPKIAQTDHAKNGWMREHGFHLFRLVNDNAVLRDPVGLIRLALLTT